MVARHVLSAEILELLKKDKSDDTATAINRFYILLQNDRTAAGILVMKMNNMFSAGRNWRLCRVVSNTG